MFKVLYVKRNYSQRNGESREDLVKIRPEACGLITIDLRSYEGFSTIALKFLHVFITAALSGECKRICTSL